jgi:uncharacterized protein
VALRYDSATLGPIQITGAGALRAPANLTRSGVFIYRNPDGSLLREYRPPSEVFKPESVGSMQGVPVTWNHPGQGKQKVNAANWKEVSVGHVEAPQTEEGWIVAPLVVSDLKAIQDISEAQSQGHTLGVSAAYFSETEETPGVTPEGEPYDVIQRGIRYNHLAILPPGVSPRAGKGAQLRLDSQGNQLPQETTMNEEQVATLIAEALKPLQEQLAAQQETITALEAAATAPNGETPPAVTTAADSDMVPANEPKAPAGDTTAPAEDKLRADAAEAALAAYQRNLPLLAQEYAQAKEDADSLDLATTGKNLVQLQRAVAQHVFPEFRADAAEVEVKAYYQAARKVLHKGSTVATLAGAITNGKGLRADAADADPRSKFEAEQAKRGII